MKIKTIISSLCLLLLAVSCSTEDVLDNKTGQDKRENFGSEEVYAVISPSLSSGEGLSTKASSVEEDKSGETYFQNETEVKECFVFVANGDNIIGRRHYSGTTEIVGSAMQGYALIGHIMVKVPKSDNLPTLNVYVVGMRKDNTDYFATNIFPSATTLSGLKATVVGKYSADKGNSLTDFIKVGENTVAPYSDTNTNGYGTSEKTSDFEHNNGSVHCGKVSVDLKLRLAAIEIVSFKIKDSKGNVTFDSEDSKIGAEATRRVVTDIQLGTEEQGGQIVNTVLNTGEAIAKVRSYTSYKKAWDKMSDKDKVGSNPMGYRFYTYQNTESPTMITISYTDTEGLKSSITFSVKTPSRSDVGYVEEVLANHLYRISVEIKNKVASVDVQFYTLDWVKHDIIYDVTK